MGAMVEQLETCHSCSMVELCQMASPEKFLSLTMMTCFAAFLPSFLGTLGTRSYRQIPGGQRSISLELRACI